MPASMAPKTAPAPLFTVNETAPAEEVDAGAPVDVELPDLAAELAGWVAVLEGFVAGLEPPVVVAPAAVEAAPLLASVNETESVVVTLPVGVTLAAEHSASCRARAAVRSAEVQCAAKQAPASAWN